MLDGLRASTAVCCAQQTLREETSHNIDSIRAVRRFMPGGLLAELAGADRLDSDDRKAGES